MTAPYYADESVTLYLGDCLDVLRTLPDASVDSVVTDPPYGLEFMGKDWDAPWKAGEGVGGHSAGFSQGAPAVPGVRGAIKALPSYTGSTNPTCRNCGGTRNGNDRASRRRCVCGKPEFPNTTLPRMIAYQQWCVPWAVECLRVLKPGGHLLAFGGTRTSHRLACAVEDAGFEIRDSIAWLYGSGFPKSLDVSKAIDKLDATGERRRRNLAFTAWMRSTGITSGQIDAVTSSFMGGHYLTVREQAAVPTADMFNLLRPLVSVTVPAWVEALIAERTVESENFKAREVVGDKAVTRIMQGSGDLVGGTVRSGVVDITAPATPDAARWQGWGTALKPAFEPIVVGRKPLIGTVAANVLAHGTGALNVDATRVEHNEPAGKPQRGMSGRNGAGYGPGGTPTYRERETDAASTAGRWPTNVILDDSQAAELDRQSGDVRSSGLYVKGSRGFDPGTGTRGDAPFGVDGLTSSAYGDSGGASRFFPTFHYEAKAPTLERPRHGETAHPTVKPLDLMRWLVRLVTPPGGTVLDPFAGSGTTGEACVIEGFKCIAIEREADYLPLIVQRLTKPIAPVLNFGESA